VSSLKNSQRPHDDSPDLRILKIGPKEQPFGSGYNTSIRRWAMRPTELVSASRVAILEQLSASIGEINQPISALVLNAEAALQLLLAQPTNTRAVRRLLACIVKDGLRDRGHRSPHPCADREGAAGRRGLPPFGG
jgi:hypothetical protein